MRHFKLFLTFLLLTALGIGNCWGEDVTGTINFGSGTGDLNVNSASVSGNDSQSNSWTVTTVGTTSFTPNADYAQIGASKSPATSITFTTTLPASQTITSFSAKFGGFSGTAGTVTLKVGDTSVGTDSLSGTNDVTVSNTNSTTSGTVLTVTVTGISKGVKVYYISYTYSEGSDPAIVASKSSLTKMSYSEGSGPSTAETFTVSGQYLTENATVTAPTNFEVSSDGTNYSNSVTLTQTSGSIASTTVYVRLAAGLAKSADYAGNVTVTSKGATTKNIAVTGEVEADKNAVAAGTYDIVPGNSLWGTSYTSSNSSTTANNLDLSGTVYGVSFNLKNGSATSMYVTDTQLRVYNNYTLKVTAPTGYKITNITFTADGTNWAGTHTASVGTMTDNKTWDGSANAVTISFKGTCRMTGIKVTYALDLPSLSDPTNLRSSSITATTASLSWDAVENATGYKVKIGSTEYDANTNSYSATGLTGSTQYTWTVKAIGNGTNYNSSDYATSVNFTTLAPSAAPTITTHPTSATYNQNATATALSVAANGNPAPSYQWYSNTTNSNENGTVITGETNATYTPSTATAGTFYYYAVATNSEGSAKSNVATITVNALVAPSFTTQPTAAEYIQNATATALTVEVSGTPAPTYQWYSNSSNSTDGATAISGATLASYTPSTATVGTTYYYCVATNSVQSTTSSIVAVVVKEIPTYAAKFWSNGSVYSAANYKEGENIAFPENDPSVSNDGIEFICWTENTIDGTTDTKPTPVISATMGTEVKNFYAVYATVEDGASGYKLVSSLTEGKKYVFVTRNTAGNGYALASTVTTGTSVTIAASGDDKVVSGTPANSIVWTKGAQYGNISGSFDLQNVGTSTVYLKINGTSLTTADASYPTFGDSSKGLYGKSSTGTGSTSYYLLNSNGTFSKGTGSTTNRVYAYEEFSNKTYSDYCTTVAAAPVLSSIAITTAPTKTKYKVGEMFDGTGMVVTATYVGGSTKTIASSKYTISKTTALATSDASITVSYTEGEVEKTATQTINVLALDHLTITTAPTKVTYEENETLAVAGMVVKGTWGTGETTIEEPITGYTCDPADGTTLATTNDKFTVSYTHEGTTKTVDQTITVTELPTWSTNFYINSATPTVKQAKKGSSVEVPAVVAPVDFEFMGWANATLDETETAPASYALGKSATTYTATADGGNFYAVFKKKETEEFEGGYKLSVVSGSTTYYVGARSGSNSYFSYPTSIDNAEVFFITGDNKMYYYADGGKLYFYASNSSTISFTTKESDASAWKITNNADGTCYYQTSSDYYLAFNTSQNRFATYSSTTSFPHAFTKTSATKTVELYKYSTSATVSALSSIAITTAPTKTAYYAGDDFDKTGMVVKATYDNGKTRTVTDDVTIANSTNLAAGTTSLTVSYTENEVEKTTTQAITVAAIELSDIEITTAPTKVTYLVGDNFETTGMVVKAHYNDSRKDKEITTYTVTDGESLTKDKETVTISYTEGEITKTATQAIKVNSALQSIAITTNPTKMEYTEGESFDKAGMVVTAYYGDNTNHAVENYTVTPDGALNTVGTQTMTVHYTEQGAEKTATVDVTVNAYPTYAVTFKVKGQEDNVQTETTGKAGVTVPANPAKIGDYTFAGWSTTEVSEETTTAPTYITITDGKYYPTKNEPVYAVFTMNKEIEVPGFTISTTWTPTNGVETIYYASAPACNGDKVPATTTASKAKTFFRDAEDYIYFYLTTNSVKTKYYLQGVQSDAKLNVKSKKSDANAFIFGENEIKVSNGAATPSYRWMAYAAPVGSSANNYFRLYGSNAANVYNVLTFGIGSETDLKSVAHYTINPSAEVKPTLDFGTPTTTVVADQTVKNVATTNSTATVTYSSSDETVATVAADGTVTGHKYGTATITASVAEVEDAFYANSVEYTITVNRITTSIKFDGFEDRVGTATVYAGNEYTFTASTNAKEGDVDAPVIVYSLSNTTYATIDSETGVVTMKAATSTSNPQVTLYAKVPDSNTRYTSCNSSTTYAKLTLTIKDNRKNQTIGFTNATYNFTANETVENFTNALTGTQKGAVTYSSNNTSIAEVNETTGEVTVHTNASGTATITATAAAATETIEGVEYAYEKKEATFTITVAYPAPTFSPAGGEIKAPVSVVLSAGAEDYIQYTTDGSTPDDKSNTYSDPIEVNETTTIKAYSTDHDEQTSAIVSATYTKVLPTVNSNVTNNETFDLNSKTVTLTAESDVLISYTLYNANDVQLEEMNNQTSPVTITLPRMGQYKVMYTGTWNCENGFSNESELIAFTASGIGHLPINFTGGKADLPGCFTTSGVDTKDYNAPNTKLKMNSDGATVTVHFAEQPTELNYYLLRNGEGTGYVFDVEESSNGTTYTSLMKHTESNNDTKVAGSTAQWNDGTKFTVSTFAEGTRYIRWKFTTRESGTNMGLGTISIKGDMSGEIEVDGVSTTEIPEGFQGSVTVVNGASLEINSEVTVNNVTIEAGATVEASDNVTISGDLVLKADMADKNTPAKAAQLTYVDGYFDVTGDVFVEVKLTPSGVAEYGWYAFAVPFEVDVRNGVYGKNVGGDWHQLTLESDYAIMHYQGDVRAQGQYGWIKTAKKSNVLRPGVFYLVTVADTDFGTLRFKKTTGSTINNEGNIELKAYGVSGSGVAGTDNGWNGVANNALTNVDLTFGEIDKVQVYYHSTNSFDAITVSSNSFVMGSPFFAKAGASGDELEFSSATHGTLQAPKRAAAAISEFNVRLGKNSNDYDDQIYLSASEDATNTYQDGAELVKASMGTAKVAQMYVSAYGNMQLCDAEFPLANNQAEFPIVMTAPAAGEYTLYVNEAPADADLYLVQNGAIIWNLTMSEYEIDLSQGTTTGYSLRLVKKAPQITTGTDNVTVGGEQVEKMIINDHLIIRKGQKMYDATGKAVE